MKISSMLKTYNVYEGGSTVSSKKAGPKKDSADTVALSSSGKDYQVAAKALSQTSNVRQDRIAAIKAQMEEGTYSVDASLVADKMLKRFFV